MSPLPPHPPGPVRPSSDPLPTLNSTTLGPSLLSSSVLAIKDYNLPPLTSSTSFADVGPTGFGQKRGGKQIDAEGAKGGMGSLGDQIHNAGEGERTIAFLECEMGQGEEVELDREPVGDLEDDEEQEFSEKEEEEEDYREEWDGEEREREEIEYGNQFDLGGRMNSLANELAADTLGEGDDRCDDDDEEEGEDESNHVEELSSSEQEDEDFQDLSTVPNFTLLPPASSLSLVSLDSASLETLVQSYLLVISTSIKLHQDQTRELEKLERQLYSIPLESIDTLSLLDQHDTEEAWKNEQGEELSLEMITETSKSLLVTLSEISESLQISSIHSTDSSRKLRAAKISLMALEEERDFISLHEESLRRYARRRSGGRESAGERVRREVEEVRRLLGVAERRVQEIFS